MHRQIVRWHTMHGESTEKCLKPNSTAIARFAFVNAGLSQTRAMRFTDRSIPFVVPPTRHDTTETREKEEREADRCREMQWAKYAHAGLGSNYYSRSLIWRVVLNMARAALIREREFRRARAPTCIPGQKPKSGAENGPPPRYRRSKMRSKNCRQFELLIRTVRESYLGRSSA